MRDKTPEASGGKTYPEPWLIPGKLRWLYRFLLGRPMDNAIRTNATFWHRATTGYPSRWLYLAGWQRAAIRLSVTYALLGAAVVYLMTLMGLVTVQAVLTAHAVVLLVTAAPVLLVRLLLDYGISYPVPALVIVHKPRSLPRVRLEGWVRYTMEGRKTWDRTRVRPVAASVDRVLGTFHQPSSARRWVHVPRDFTDPRGRPVVIQLPANFIPDKGTSQRLVAAVEAKLGMRDLEPTWQLAGDSPRLLLAAPVTPPKKVTWADVEKFLLATEEYRPFLGVNARLEGVSAEMVNDSPHIAVSAGSGAGKSEFVKLIIMQSLRWGWGVVILDWKEVSHQWAEGLPGVRIVRDIQDIHDWLVTLAEDLDTRKRAYREDPQLSGRAKVLVVYEEMNATSDLLMAYWQDLRATEPDPEVRRTMPLKSPALRAQNAIVFGGRQFGMFKVGMAQRFSARITQGNADIRENFNIKAMARYSTATVKMLCPDVKPFPKRPTQVGGWVIVTGDGAQVIQAPLITTEEAREYAMGGVENPSHPLTSTHFPDMSQRAGRSSTLEDSLGPVSASPTTVDGALVGDVLEAIDPKKLADMWAELVPLGITSLAALRKESTRDKGFPKPCGGSPNQGFLYDVHSVRLWARKRHARSIASKAAR